MFIGLPNLWVVIFNIFTLFFCLLGENSGGISKINYVSLVIHSFLHLSVVLLN